MPLASPIQTASQDVWTIDTDIIQMAPARVPKRRTMEGLRKCRQDIAALGATVFSQ
jgi:hypothetical protein